MRRKAYLNDTGARKAFLFVSVILLCVAACTRTDRLEGHVYYRLNANPSTLDPARITDVSSAVVAAKLFNGLVKLGEDLSAAPDIAERWTISGDGTRYVFHLRKDVRFANGRAVTADDVLYSFERVLSPAVRSPVSWVFDKVDGAGEMRSGKSPHVRGFRVLGDHAFEIRLTRPFSPFLQMLTMTAAYIVPKEEADRPGDAFSMAPSGTGPYVLTGWSHNNELRLQARQGYFEGAPKVAGIVYRIIPEDLTAITEFELGNIDILSLPGTAYARYSAGGDGGYRLLSMKGLNTYYLGMNASRPPFDDPAVRRAVSLAIDRETILRTFYEGRGRLAAGPVPDILRTWELSETAAHHLPYDPLKARETLDRLGLRGRQVALYTTADQEVIDLSEIIQGYLKKAGLAVTITQLEWSAFKEAINRGDPDLFWLSWWADYADPENFLFPLFHSSNIGPAGNRTRYSNREVDLLIERGQGSVRQRDRDLHFRKAEEILIRESPWVPFWHKTDYVVVRSSIGGYRIYPIYTMDKGMDIHQARAGS